MHLRLDITIKESLRQIVADKYPEIQISRFDLTHPERLEHGDYATNVAMILAKQLQRKPSEVANEIEAIWNESHQTDYIDHIEVTPSGYINFFLTKNYLLQELHTIVSDKDSYGQGDGLKGQKILLEYGQPNTHKMPHIGHLFSYVYGESCARILSAAGADVKRLNYQGDVGLHVAKCLWGYRNTDAEKAPETLEEKVQWLQRCYQAGAQAYEDNPEAKTAIDHLNDDIYKKRAQAYELWKQTRQWSIDYYVQFEDRLGIHFDKHYFESEILEPALKLVDEHMGKVFESSQGAVIFAGEKYGLHTRVFVNQRGNPTYEAKDVGLIATKRDDFTFDHSVVMTGNEQNDYWRVLEKVTGLIFPDLVSKIQHLGYGMINLSTGKMSSRTGNIVTAFGLVDMVKEQVRAFVQANREYDEKQTEQISEAVGMAAIRYSFLKKVAAKDLAFDIKTSVAFEGNSGPYLQYAYARCQSVLAKAPKLSNSSVDRDSASLEPEEVALMRHLYRLPEVIDSAARNYAPHELCNYVYSLASLYSVFYDHHKILVDDEMTTRFRLLLTQATAQVIGNGLKLLGIEALDQI
jgi:arginyl-tRNA synthetase